MEMAAIYLEGGSEGKEGLSDGSQAPGSGNSVSDGVIF